MADTTALKNRIRAAIKANDNQEITGPVLQQTLLDMVDELDLYPELENEVNTRQQADTTSNIDISNVKAAIADNKQAIADNKQAIADNKAAIENNKRAILQTNNNNLDSLKLRDEDLAEICSKNLIDINLID